MKTAAQLKAELAQLAAKAKPFALREQAGEALTDDESREYDQIVAQMNEVGPQLREAEAREARAKNVLDTARDYTEPAGRVAARMVVGGQEGRAQDSNGARPDTRSPGRRFVESEEYKRAIQPGASGIMKDSPVRVGSLFGSRYHPIEHYAGYHEGVLSPQELRAVIGSGTAPASMLLPTILPTIYRGQELPLRVRDVILNLRTTSDTIRFMSETGFTNSAAEVAEATAVDGTGLTGGVKPESALTFTETDAPVETIAHWVPITRRMLADIPAMETYVNTRLMDGLARREDAQLLNGNGTTPNIRGILNTSGIQVADAAYFTGAPVNDAGTDNENLNRIRRAKRLISWTAQATPTFIVANPVDVEVWDTLTDANRNYLFGGPAGGMQRTLWGLPVVETATITAGSALVGDGTMAAVFDREDAQIYTTDSHADFFIRNLFVILAEERLALAVFRPAAFVEVELAA